MYLRSGRGFFIIVILIHFIWHFVKLFLKIQSKYGQGIIDVAPFVVKCVIYIIGKIIQCL